MKKVLAGLIIAGLASAASADIVMQWTFEGATPIVNQVAGTIGANLDTGGIYNDMTRGAGAGTSAGASSFRTTGFQNNGIDIANTDYFQFIISAANGYALSLSGINAAFVGTTTYSAAPGVSHQWGYRLGDSGDFTLIDSAVLRQGNGNSSFDFSGTAALQNVAAGSDVYLRYFATGQTSTGGWGFNSAGVEVNGTVVAIPEPGVMALLAIGGLAVLRFARRRKA